MTPAERAALETELRAGDPTAEEIRLFAAGIAHERQRAAQVCKDFAATLEVESNRMAAWKCGYLIEQGEPLG